ncbi:MAG: ribonuclease H-like domain-containing protein [Nanoarchaeota archaeon]|nr:ribonuclease H-like domain-containing protein [Nanoarchaeota archaeon]
MKIKFVPIDFSSFDFEGRNIVRIIGRTENGKRICILDSYEPNFWIIMKDDSKRAVDKVLLKLSKIDVKDCVGSGVVLKTKVLDKKFLGKSVRVIRVYIQNHKDLGEFTKALGDMNEIEYRREMDINIITKYIKEREVEPLVWHEIEVVPLGLEDFGGYVDFVNIDSCYSAKSFKKLKDEKAFVPKILSYDIETSEFDSSKGEILSIGIHGSKISKVFTWKKTTGGSKFLEFFKDEAAMLEGFVLFVKEYEPDILTGYFSDGFDLPYLKARSKSKKIRLALGVDSSEPVFSRGRIPTGRISGVVHVDLFRFIDAVFAQYMQTESMGLNGVAKELIGEGKDDFDFNKLTTGKMTNKDWNEFFSYNLQDAVITYKLARKIWPDMVEFASILKEPLFNVTRNRMAAMVENHIIHNLDRFEEIGERRPTNEDIAKRRAKGKFEGALVFEPKAGLYEDICVFDFTSMHASIIVSLNLSKSTLLEKKEKGAISTPEFLLDGKRKVFYFSKKPGFFSILLSEIVEKRKKYKAEYNHDKNLFTRARSNAYKLLANASYGYLAYFGGRYYSRESAASTLAFVRKFTTDSMSKIEKAGYGIIFSDTDSIGFTLNGKSHNETLRFLKELNSGLPGIMELDLEDFYKRGLFVTNRSKTAGAKKKYAFLDSNDKLKIRGFETVRRDWCMLTRNLQSKVLSSILIDGNEKTALELLKKTVADLKNRKVNTLDLIIKTQLRRPINEYKSIGPHVVAAKKMEAAGVKIGVGQIIEYFIGGNNGRGKRVGDRVYLKDEKVKYDIEYYLNNQVLPAVENIFDVFGINVNEIVEGSTQKKLF